MPAQVPLLIEGPLTGQIGARGADPDLDGIPIPDELSYVLRYLPIFPARFCGSQEPGELSYLFEGAAEQTRQMIVPGRFQSNSATNRSSSARTRGSSTSEISSFDSSRDSSDACARRSDRFQRRVCSCPHRCGLKESSTWARTIRACLAKLACSTGPFQSCRNPVVGGRADHQGYVEPGASIGLSVRL